MGRIFVDGRHRELVFLKDILGEAALRASCNDLVVFTNDDALLHPSIIPVLQKAAALGFAHALRCGLKDESEWRRVLLGGRVWTVGRGRDLFVFKADFLNALLPDFPDFLVGAHLWDLYLATHCHFLTGRPVDTSTARSVRRATGLTLKDSSVSTSLVGAIPPGHVFHIDHTAFWEQGSNLYELPSQKHNLRVAREGLMSMGALQE
jgi:hypothetical protein